VADELHQRGFDLIVGVDLAGAEPSLIALFACCYSCRIQPFVSPPILPQHQLQRRDLHWDESVWGKRRGVTMPLLKLEVGFSSSSCGTSDEDMAPVTV